MDLISVVARKGLLGHHQMDTTRYLGLPVVQFKNIYTILVTFQLYVEVATNQISKWGTRKR